MKDTIESRLNMQLKRANKSSPLNGAALFREGIVRCEGSIYYTIYCKADTVVDIKLIISLLRPHGSFKMHKCDQQASQYPKEKSCLDRLSLDEAPI
jgi:hypothetical protein